MKAAVATGGASARRQAWAASAPSASAIGPVAVLGTGTSLLVSAFAWVADPQAGLGSAAPMLEGLWVFVTSLVIWMGALHSVNTLRADLSLLRRRAAPQAAAAQTLQHARRLWAGWALALLPPTLIFSLVGTGRWADPLHLAGPALQLLLFALAWTHAAAWHGLHPARGLLAGLAAPAVWGWWAFSEGGPRRMFEHQPAALAGLCALALLAVAWVAKDLSGRAALSAHTASAEGTADRPTPCQRWNAWWTRRALRWQPLDPSSGWGIIFLSTQVASWLSRPDSWLRVWGDDVGFASAMALAVMTLFMLSSLRTDALHWRLLLAPGPGGRRWLGLRILLASAGFVVICLGVLTLGLAAVFSVMIEMSSTQVDWTAWVRVASKVWVPLALDLATALCLAMLSRRLGLGRAMALLTGSIVLLVLAAAADFGGGSAFATQLWWPRNAWSNAAQGLLILALAWAANQAWRSVDLAQLMKQRQKALDEQAELRGEARSPRR
ncbi:MAG: hypothetical protein ACKO8N_10960 [Rubrivivax sp.]